MVHSGTEVETRLCVQTGWHEYNTPVRGLLFSSVGRPTQARILAV
jgi:hypothetical protein